MLTKILIVTFENFCLSRLDKNKKRHTRLYTKIYDFRNLVITNRQIRLILFKKSPKLQLSLSITQLTTYEKTLFTAHDSPQKRTENLITLSLYITRQNLIFYFTETTHTSIDTSYPQDPIHTQKKNYSHSLTLSSLKRTHTPTYNKRSDCWLACPSRDNDWSRFLEKEGTNKRTPRPSQVKGNERNGAASIN